MAGIIYPFDYHYNSALVISAALRSFYLSSVHTGQELPEVIGDLDFGFKNTYILNENHIPLGNSSLVSIAFICKIMTYFHQKVDTFATEVGMFIAPLSTPIRHIDIRKGDKFISCKFH